MACINRYGTLDVLRAVRSPSTPPGATVVIRLCTGLCAPVEVASLLAVVATFATLIAASVVWQRSVDVVARSISLRTARALVVVCAHTPRD